MLVLQLLLVVRLAQDNQEDEHHFDRLGIPLDYVVEGHQNLLNLIFGHQEEYSRVLLALPLRFL